MHLDSPGLWARWSRTQTRSSVQSRRPRSKRWPMPMMRLRRRAPTTCPERAQVMRILMNENEHQYDVEVLSKFARIIEYSPHRAPDQGP